MYLNEILQNWSWKQLPELFLESIFLGCFKALWYVVAPQSDQLWLTLCYIMWTCQLEERCEQSSLIIWGKEVSVTVVTKSASGALVWTELLQRACVLCQSLMGWLASY